MHGRNRVKYKAQLANPEVAANLSKKALTWNTLTKDLLSRRQQNLGGVGVGVGASAPPSAPPVPSPSDSTPTATHTSTLTHTYTDPTILLQLTEKLLTVNPDPSHLWNHRRELLLGKVNGSSTVDPVENRAADGSLFTVEDELTLTATCLQRNPKAYGAWFHRKWCLRHHLRRTNSNTSTTCDPNTDDAERIRDSGVLTGELALCSKFLLMDNRNFHCWNFRRFVVGCALEMTSYHILLNENGNSSSSAEKPNLRLDGSWNNSAFQNVLGGVITMGPQIATSPSGQDAKEHENELSSSALANSHGCCLHLRDGTWFQIIQNEWDFTTEKIESNFSNCSAFHYRSKLIPLLLQHRIDQKQRTDGNNSAVSLEERYEEIVLLAREELEMVQQAIFTEPDDQTAWWYHRFMIVWASPSRLLETSTSDDSCISQAMVQTYVDILKEEAESIEELVEAEDGRCKWGLLACHMILGTLLGLYSKNGDLGMAGTEECVIEETKRKAEECLNTLTLIDSDRVVRYQGLRSG